MPTLTLPNGTTLSLKEVLAAVDTYSEDYPAVFDLYDLPESGPHDEVRPIDLLAMNALDAWGRGQPMTWMTTAWLRRDEIACAVKAVSKLPFEELSGSQVNDEVQKVGAALEFVDSIPGYGYTATAKLFHRLRPNLGPIWDRRVERWYPADENWTQWVDRVYGDVRRAENIECLQAVRKHLGVPLSILRVWEAGIVVASSQSTGVRSEA